MNDGLLAENKRLQTKLDCISSSASNILQEKSSDVSTSDTKSLVVELSKLKKNLIHARDGERKTEMKLKLLQDEVKQLKSKRDDLEDKITYLKPFKEENGLLSNQHIQLKEQIKILQNENLSLNNKLKNEARALLNEVDHGRNGEVYAVEKIILLITS